MTVFGAGKTRIKTKTAPTNFGQIIMMPTRLTNFSMEVSSDEKVAQAMIDGTLQDVYSAIGAETREVTLESQVADWWEMGFYVMDELPQTSSNIPWPASATGTVASAAIADAALVSGNLASVRCWQTADASGNPVNIPLKAGSAPLSSGEFEASVGSIAFHTDQEGGSVTYEYARTYTSGSTLGREPTFDRWGTIEAAGIIYMGGMPSGIGVVFKRLQRTSKANLEVNDGVPTLSTTFKATIPAGDRSAIELIDLGSLVA